MLVVYFQLDSQDVRVFSRQWWAELLTGLIGRSEYKHCCIGDGEVVYARRFDGSSFYPSVPFERHSALFGTDFKVVLPVACNLSDLPLDAKASIWRGFVTFFSRGESNGMDCVSVVCSVLNKSGLGVPRGTVTPDQLLAFLEGRGYEREPVGHQAAPPC